MGLEFTDQEGSWYVDAFILPRNDKAFDFPLKSMGLKYLLNYHVLWSIRALVSLLPSGQKLPLSLSIRMDFLCRIEKEVDSQQTALPISNFPLLYISKCLWYTATPEVFRLHAYFKIFCLLYDLHRSLTSHLALVTLFIQLQYTLKSVPWIT